MRPSIDFIFYLNIIFFGVASIGNGEAMEKVKIRGQGASFPKTVYTQWIDMFKETRRKAGVHLEMIYKSLGSSAGIEAIMKGTDVEYAGSDVSLTTEQAENNPNILTFPTMAGPVVFGYNLGDVVEGNLNLTISMETAIEIYNGSITHWDDPRLQSLNPNLTLPSEKIKVIARYDKSGTTNTVTSAFSLDSHWNRTYGSFFEKSGWKNKTIAFYGNSTVGMAGLIRSFKYSIGYLGWADATDVELQYASLKNWEGFVVHPTLGSVQLAMDEAARVMTHELALELSSQQTERSYPIASFTYMLVRMDVDSQCDSVRELSRYIYWLTRDKGASSICREKNMVPVTSSIAERIEELILQKLSCQGENVWPSVKASIIAEHRGQDNGWQTPVIIGVTVVVTLLFGISCYFIMRQIQKNRALDKDLWEIPIEDIVFYTTAKSQNGDKSRFVMWNSVRSLKDADEIEDGYQMVQHILQWPGKWSGLSVGLRLLEIKEMTKVSRATKRLLLSMRDDIIHYNVLNFYGLAELQGERYVVSDYCSKGPLSDLLKNPKYTFNTDCKFSLALDIIGGLAFLHSKGIIHGNLRTSSCLVDFKWMVKIADWEYCHLFSHLDPKRNPLAQVKKTADEIGKDAEATLDFWTAPELLKPGNTVHPTLSCDIYSYAIVLQETFTRKDAYTQYLETLSPSEVLKAVISNNLRPSHDEETPTTVRQILEYAWSESPSMRPSCEQIQKMLKQAHSFKKSVLDNMVEAAEDYTNSLEEKLKEQTAQLEAAEAKIGAMQDYMVPPLMQKRLSEKGKTSDIEITSTASIIIVKIILEAKGSRRKASIVKEMDRLEKRLDRITKHYNAFKIDYTSGIYVIIYGAGSREKRKAIQAARMAFEIISEDEIPQTSSHVYEVFYQCAMHHGSIYTGLVKFSMPPKCYIMGNAIEETYRLLAYSRKSRVLVSRNFKDALTIFALDYFRLEANASTSTHKDGDPVVVDETYWLFKKEGMEYKKWHSVISATKQCDTKSSSLSSNENPSVDNKRPILSRQPSFDKVSDELPITRIPSIIDKHNSQDNGFPPPIERSISAPFMNNLYNPFNSSRSHGPFTRSNSFTAGTIASLRNLLSRTLPPTPSYKMKIISQVGSEEASDNFDTLPFEAC